jgi:hypothetical protein
MTSFHLCNLQSANIENMGLNGATYSTSKSTFSRVVTGNNVVDTTSQVSPESAFDFMSVVIRQWTPGGTEGAQNAVMVWIVGVWEIQIQKGSPIY